uniref:HET domain-containing protein n=1 Tax=Ascaris lumbricoides TaxID=6252 RepID=A0A0M3IMB1_ASCLU
LDRGSIRCFKEISEFILGRILIKLVACWTHLAYPFDLNGRTLCVFNILCLQDAVPYTSKGLHSFYLVNSRCSDHTEVVLIDDASIIESCLGLLERQEKKPDYAVVWLERECGNFRPADSRFQNRAMLVLWRSTRPHQQSLPISPPTRVAGNRRKVLQLWNLQLSERPVQLGVFRSLLNALLSVLCNYERGVFLDFTSRISFGRFIGESPVSENVQCL